MHTFRPYSLRHSDLLYEDIPLEIREQIILLIINTLGNCSSFIIVILTKFIEEYVKRCAKSMAYSPYMRIQRHIWMK
ncbi:putative cytoplasmic protein [Salmonella enterica subsp. enterica serovar Gallinarum]|nr:putative cytoplasmic protein [Salmonella enterica subsp. enterica serovar Gallinarum]